MKTENLMMTQLSGVASIIFSCLKMGMWSPIELNSPTIVAILLAVYISHPASQPASSLLIRNCSLATKILED